MENLLHKEVYGPGTRHNLTPVQEEWANATEGHSGARAGFGILAYKARSRSGGLHPSLLPHDHVDVLAMRMLNVPPEVSFSGGHKKKTWARPYRFDVTLHELHRMADGGVETVLPRRPVTWDTLERPRQSDYRYELCEYRPGTVGAALCDAIASAKNPAMIRSPGAGFVTFVDTPVRLEVWLEDDAGKLPILRLPRNKEFKLLVAEGEQVTADQPVVQAMEACKYGRIRVENGRTMFVRQPTKNWVPLDREDLLRTGNLMTRRLINHETGPMADYGQLPAAYLRMTAESVEHVISDMTVSDSLVDELRRVLGPAGALSAKPFTVRAPAAGAIVEFIDTDPTVYVAQWPDGSVVYIPRAYAPDLGMLDKEFQAGEPVCNWMPRRLWTRSEIRALGSLLPVMAAAYIRDSFAEPNSNGNNYLVPAKWLPPSACSLAYDVLLDFRGLERFYVPELKVFVFGALANNQQADWEFVANGVGYHLGGGAVNVDSYRENKATQLT